MDGGVAGVVDTVVEAPPSEPVRVWGLDYFFLDCSSSTALAMLRAMVAISLHGIGASFVGFFSRMYWLHW